MIIIVFNSLLVLEKITPYLLDRCHGYHLYIIIINSVLVMIMLRGLTMGLKEYQLT